MFPRIASTMMIFSSIASSFFTISLPAEDRISFQSIKDLIFVQVHIKESGPYPFFIDTGVIPSVIDRSLAEKLNLDLKIEDVGNVSGRGNQNRTFVPTKITQLKVGGLDIQDIDAGASNMQFLQKAIGSDVNGILGYSFLKDKIFTIDYQSKQLTFYESSEQLIKQLGENTYTYKFVFLGNDIMPAMENLKLNDKPFVATIDTGSNFGLGVFQHCAEDFGIEIDPTKTINAQGARGKFQSQSGVADSFDFADYTFNRLPVVISPVQNTKQTRKGNIGNQFLKQFRISFDYPKKLIALEKYDKE